MKLRTAILAALVCAVAAVLAAPAANAATGDDKAPRIPRKAAKTERLGASLAEVLRVERAGGSGVAKARSLGLSVKGDNVRVVVEAAGTTGTAEAAVRAAGGRVEATHANLVQALVRPAALDGLRAAAGVRFVRPPHRPQLDAISGEEIAASAADTFQSALWTGAGVKVAIIDAGFGGLAARQANGDLPMGVVTQDMCGGEFNLEPHGTGVAEIVHEVAPGAQLYLICIDSDVTLGQAKDYAKAQGVTVVNMSLSFLNVSRGDGNGGPGTPDATVADARANGILWVNSAGNYQQRHWSGTFNGGGDNEHDWAPGDEGNTIFLGTGQQSCVFLKWDAWPTTTLDYDLYLVRSADGVIVAGSENFQSPGGAPPTEEFCFTNGGAPQNFFILIFRFDAPSSPRFDLIATFPNLEYRVTATSLTEPSSSPNAMAVGALCWADGSLRSYSSLGPTIDGRTKPDIVGLDGVSGGTYGIPSGCSGGFTGTSASSPHVAGLAALGKHQNPSLTPAQLQTWLEARALDVATAGKDNFTGAGRAYVFTFTDSPPTRGGVPGTPLQNYIEQLFRKGTTTGCTLLDVATGSRSYCPDQQVTRRDMAVFIIRSLEETPFINPTPTFADVPADLFGYGHVERFFQLGITTGCSTIPQMLFCPLATITRRDMAVFIIRSLEETPFINPTPTFADVPADMFGYGHVERFFQLGITTGCVIGPPRLYCPLDFVDRKAMAAFLIRAYGAPS